MDTSQHNLKTLFQQLGLDASPKAIDSFIENHHLDDEVRLAEAPFWNNAQAAFIRESLQEDADWCEVIDTLDAMLRH